MTVTYKDNEQIVHEIKKLIIDEKTTQREIAAKLSITPQGLTKMLSKKILDLRMLKRFCRPWDMIWF